MCRVAIKVVAEIISVGTELLMGQIVNTDAQYVAEKLSELGIDMLHQSVVGDNFERLNENLKTAEQRADIIITTGGLGPTDDDMTKECVCEFCEKKLVLNDDALDDIKEYFKKKNIEFTPNNEKQAKFPKDAVILKNSVGTAPGCIINARGKVFIVLPGPPRELKPMFKEYVVPYLKDKCSDVLFTKNVQVFGLGESKVEHMIKDIIRNQSNPTIATYCHPGYVTIRITSKAENEEKAKALVDPVAGEVINIFGDSVFEVGDRSITETVAGFLIDKEITISVSESCTGGLVSDALVKVSGISSVFKLGVVSYSNEAKMNMLGVKKETLDTVGAVSRETAIQMARGVMKAGNSDIGISTTGIAGPGSDNTNKPVGLVYIALSHEEETVVEELHLNGTRNDIRQMTVLQVFNMIRKYFMDKGE